MYNYNQTGLFRHDGTPKAAVSNGTIRNYIPPLSCSLYGYPNNYFNYYNMPNTNILTGTVVDGNNNKAPIKNAVIMAWHTVQNPLPPHNDLWEDFYFTYTKDNGTFELKADKSIDIVWVAFIGKDRNEYYNVNIIPNPIVLNNPTNYNPIPLN
jgi:hypothetical protein